MPLDVRRIAAAAGEIVLGSALLGAIAGAVWAWCTPDAAGVLVTGGVAPADELSVGRLFSSVGVFVVISAVAGPLSVALAYVRHRRVGVALPVVAVVGGLVGAYVAVRTGQWLGPDPIAPTTITEADVGTRVLLPLDMDAKVAYLVWPITALFTLVWILLAASDPAPPRHAAPRHDAADVVTPAESVAILPMTAGDELDRAP